MMRSFQFAAGAFLLGAAAVSSSLAGTSIEQHRWKERLLIVFAANAASPALGRQRAIAKGMGSAMQQRDLVQIEVVGETVLGADESAAALRGRYGVQANAFRVLLIGKDGGVKMESAEPVSGQRLAETIDAMPMRRREAAGKE
jgi:Domain of unknown function (DUF4174)